MDVWRVEAGRKTILWFGKQPGDRLVYTQSLVIVNDDEPDWAYYFDLGVYKYVGRYSFVEDKYSLLPKASQRADLQDIPQSAFPAPGPMPNVKDVFTNADNENSLLDPPPTKQYPRLRNSSWVSSYLSTAATSRVKYDALITFNSATGTYNLQRDKSGKVGVFENIQYTVDKEGQFIIAGVWRREQSSGYFRFVISPANLNVFQGEWGQNGRIEGTWTGTRKRIDR
jgi:hypothetical protein